MHICVSNYSKMKKMKKIFVLLFIACSLFAQAQTTIKGKVQDASGNPMAFANVSIEETFEGTSTDDAGNYEIQTDLHGVHLVSINYLGFEPVTQKVDLQGKTIVLNFVLEEKFNELTAVTVTAGSFEASDKKKAAVLKPLDIVTTAGAMGDIGNALQTLPGTTTVGESGRLFVRGGSSEETQTYIDGMHAAVPYTSGAPNYSVRGRFNPFLFKGTVFNTGGYSAEYGQALSSVLLLETKGFDAKDRFDISIMTVGLGLAGTKVWDKTAITASLDYTDLRPYFKLSKQRFDVIDGWHSLDGALSLRQKTKNGGMIRFYATNGSGKSKIKVFDFFTADNKQTYDSKNTNRFVNASWKTPFGDKWVLNMGASYTKDINDDFYGGFNLSNELEETHLKANMTYLYSPKIKIKFGGEQFVGTISDKMYPKNIDLNQSAGFAEAQIFLSKKFVVNVGGRMEYDDYLQESKFSPRLSSALKLGAKSQVSLAYGQFYQNPQTPFLSRSNKLNFRKADHYILNYQVEQGKRLLRTEVYYKQYNQLLRFNGENNISSYQQNGDGYATGLDVFYKDMKSIKNAQFWVSYSYLMSERLYHNFPVKATPNFAAKHHASVVYKHWVNKWRSYVSISGSYSTPRPYNDPNQTSFNTGKTKSYKAVNLGWSFLPKPNVVVYASVSNVLGFKNSYGYQFSPIPDVDGHFASHELLPAADNFYFLGCFITLSRKGELNQVDQLN